MHQSSFQRQIVYKYCLLPFENLISPGTVRVCVCSQTILIIDIDKVAMGN